MNTVMYCLKNIPEDSKLRRMDSYIQHGDTTCLKHTIAVAYYSVMLAELMRIKYKKSDLVQGAVLHDYFLYDWHDGNGRQIHGFTHPSAALSNADRDFELTDTAREIIKKHMFPLTLVPPRCREAWIVCMVDKACSLYETFKRSNAYSGVRTKRSYDIYEEIKDIG